MRVAAGRGALRPTTLGWVVGILVWALAQGCVGPTRLVPRGGFRHELGEGHPLNGRIWSRAENGWVSVDRLAEAMKASDYVLLGETHDNADHHLLEARLIEAFLKAHPGAAVGFEMLDIALQPRLTSEPPRSASEVRILSDWTHSGWPDFALYAPVFEQVIAQKGRIVAVHPDRSDVRSSMRGLAPEQTRELALAEPLPEVAHQTLVEEIRTSHCGQASDAMVSAMVQAQSFKDAFMARALRQTGKRALLVAGRGHVRRDRGVPLFLARRGAGRVLSIALMDVREGAMEPRDYDIAAYDYAVFTPRVSDEDPCQRFREQLKQMNEQPARRKAVPRHEPERPGESPMKTAHDTCPPTERAQASEP